MLILSWLCEATIDDGQGSNLRAAANCFREDIASLKSSNLLILLRSHFDIPANQNESSFSFHRMYSFG